MNHERITYIYALLEPGSVVAAGELPTPECVRYVGKSVNPKRRIIMHNYAAGEGYRDRWIRSLRVDGLRPVMVFLETVLAGDDWAAREKWWIYFYREAGSRLTNITDGGEGIPGRAHPEEERKAISESNRQYWATDAGKAALIARSAARNATLAKSPESRQAIREALVRARAQREFSDWNCNLSVAQQKRWQDPEARNKARDTAIRKAQDPIVKKKMSETARRNWADPDKRAAQVATLTRPDVIAARVATCKATKARNKAVRLAALSLPGTHDDERHEHDKRQ